MLFASHPAAAPVWHPRRLAGRLSALLEAEWPSLPLWLPVALGAGVLVYFARGSEPVGDWWWLPWPLLALALALRAHRPVPAMLVGLVAAGTLGFAAAHWETQRQPPVPALPTRAVILTGEVDSVDLLPEGRRVLVRAARLGEGAAPLERSLRIRLRANDPARPQPGDQIRVRALLRPPAAPVAPGSYDFQRAAFFSGLAGSGTALGPVEILSAGSSLGFAGLRDAIAARVGAALPGAPGAVAAALLAGTQTGIPTEALVAMRDSGIAHLLSVGGLHVAIVIGLGFAVTRFLVSLAPFLALRLDAKAMGGVVGLLLGGAYTVLTGLQVPMLRAFALALVATAGLLLGRRAVSLRSMALAAAVVLLWQPDAVLGPSFQMSFAAGLALSAGWEAMRGTVRRWQGDGRLRTRALLLLAGLCLTSVIAGLATMPFGLHHFGRLQIYGVLSNAVAVPVTSFWVMPAGMLAMALMPLGLEGWALTVMGWGLDVVLLTARVVAAWPAAATVAPPIPASGLLLIAAGLCWLCLWRTRLRLLGIAPVILGIASGSWTPRPDLLVSSDGRLIALATENGVFLERASGSGDFTRDNWLRGWGEVSAQPFPRHGEAANGAVSCTEASCLLRPGDNTPMAALLRAAAVPRGSPPIPVLAAPWCGRAAVLVSAEPIRGRCPPGTAQPAIVDRFSVWRNGAHAIRLRPDGVEVVSDRAWRGDRPWVPPLPVPRLREPAAPTDEGGAAFRPEAPQ
ncbi:ComEC/Rec2 family competence protein [Roseomonas sp. BN140053]|uniref:ComEC/Rec2 family competence protein n=1 Tax=Roseomonas sp. BN140053 TaxID=3391898 RepID=UPI0039EA83B3